MGVRRERTGVGEHGWTQASTSRRAWEEETNNRHPESEGGEIGRPFLRIDGLCTVMPEEDSAIP